MTDTLRILIVEDNLSFALELEMLLDALNYQTIGRADHSAVALEMIFSQRLDLILMDIEINGKLSGIDIGRAVAHLDIPILYITALQGVPYEQAEELPATIGDLVKPVDKITLRTTINLALARTAQNKALQDATEHGDNFVNRDYLFFKKKEIYYKVAFREIAYIVQRQLLRNKDHHRPLLLAASAHEQIRAHAPRRRVPAHPPAIYRTDPPDRGDTPR